MAKKAAREAGIKLMVHIGDTEKRYDANVIRELLPIMEPGDIVTHFFTANPGGVLDSTGKLVPEAKEANDRGVWLDTAHGRSNFSFDTGQRILDQGIPPHCISTDLTVPGRATIVMPFGPNRTGSYHKVWHPQPRSCMSPGRGRSVLSHKPKSPP